LLNRANKVLGIYEVSSGGVCGTAADPKLIFSIAKKSAQAGTFLDISVLDYLIMTVDGYFSFADEGRCCP
jgi:DNA repair protein RadC